MNVFKSLVVAGCALSFSAYASNNDWYEIKGGKKVFAGKKIKGQQLPNITKIVRDANTTVEKDLKEYFPHLEKSISAYKEKIAVTFAGNEYKKFRNKLINVPKKDQDTVLKNFFVYADGKKLSGKSKFLVFDVLVKFEEQSRNKDVHINLSASQVLAKVGRSNARMNLLLSSSNWGKTFGQFKVVNKAQVSEQSLNVLAKWVGALKWPNQRSRAIDRFPLIFYKLECSLDDLKLHRDELVSVSCLPNAPKIEHIKRVAKVYDVAAMSINARLRFAEKMYQQSPEDLESCVLILREVPENQRLEMLSSILAVPGYFGPLVRETKNKQIPLTPQLMSTISRVLSACYKRFPSDEKFVEAIFRALPQNVKDTDKYIAKLGAVDPDVNYESLSLALSWIGSDPNFSASAGLDETGRKLLSLSSGKASAVSKHYFAAEKSEKRQVLKMLAANFRAVEAAGFVLDYPDEISLNNHRLAYAFVNHGLRLPSNVFHARINYSDLFEQCVKAGFCESDRLIVLFTHLDQEAIKDKSKFVSSLVKLTNGNTRLGNLIIDVLLGVKNSEDFEEVVRAIGEIKQSIGYQTIIDLKDILREVHNRRDVLGHLKFLQDVLSSRIVPEDLEVFCELGTLFDVLPQRQNVVERERSIWGDKVETAGRWKRLRFLDDNFGKDDDTIRELSALRLNVPDNWQAYLSDDQVKRYAKWMWVFERTTNVAAHQRQVLPKVLDDLIDKGIEISKDAVSKISADKFPYKMEFILRALAAVQKDRQANVAKDIEVLSKHVDGKLDKVFYDVLAECENPVAVVKSLRDYDAHYVNKMDAAKCNRLLEYILISGQTGAEYQSRSSDFDADRYLHTQKVLEKRWEKMICSSKPNLSKFVAMAVLKRHERLRLKKDSHLVRIALEKVTGTLLQELHSYDIEVAKAAAEFVLKSKRLLQINEMPDNLEDLTEEELGRFNLGQWAQWIYAACRHPEDPMNPYNLYKFLQQKRLEAVDFSKVKAEAVSLKESDETFVLCPDALQKAQRKQVYVQDLPSYNPNFMRVMLEHFEARAKRSSEEMKNIAEHVRKMSISSAENASDVWSVLKNAQSDAVLVRFLLEGLSKPTDIVSPQAAKFICTIAFIQGLSTEPSNQLEKFVDTKEGYQAVGTGTYLSDREMAYLNMLVTIPFCKSRKDEGIEKAYGLVPLSKRLSGLKTYENCRERLFEAVIHPAVVKSVDGQMSDDGDFLQSISEVYAQGVHYQQYVRNVMGHILPLNSVVEFDRHSHGCLSSRLTEIPLQTLLNRFFDSYSLQQLLSLVCAAVNEDMKSEKSTTFTDVNGLLEGQLDIKKAWDKEYKLTPLGAAHLLQLAGFVKKVEK